MQHRIGFIGSGNMAQSIALGLLDNGWKKHQLLFYSPAASSKSWIKENALCVVNDLSELVDGCSLLLVATKPSQIENALAGIKLKPEHCIISVAAGISTKFIAQLCPQQTFHIVRAMPNTAVIIGKGICGLYANTSTRSQFKDVVESIFAAVGTSIWIERESLMDIVTAVSGSGPAYYFLMVENIIHAATTLGLDQQTASKLAIETISGAAALLKSSPLTPIQLRQQVTSKGGTTEAAIGAFKNDNFQQIVFKAVNAATNRGQSLLEESLQSVNPKSSKNNQRTST